MTASNTLVGLKLASHKGPNTGPFNGRIGWHRKMQTIAPKQGHLYSSAPAGGTRMRPEPTLKGFPLMSVCGLINLTPGRSKVGLFLAIT